MVNLLWFIIGLVIGVIGIHVMYGKFVFNKIKGENRTLKEGLLILLDNEVLPVVNDKVLPKVSDGLIDKLESKLNDKLDHINNTIISNIDNITEEINLLKEELEELKNIRR